MLKFVLMLMLNMNLHSKERWEVDADVEDEGNI